MKLLIQSLLLSLSLFMGNGCVFQPDDKSADSGTSVEVVGWTGYLMDPENNPEGDQTVTLSKYDVENDDILEVQSSTSAHDGKFNFTPMEGGEYLVKASHGTLAVNSHMLIEGDQQDVDFDTLTLNVRGSISGSVSEIIDTTFGYAFSAELKMGNFLIQSSDFNDFSSFPRIGYTFANLPYGQYQLSYYAKLWDMQLGSSSETRHIFFDTTIVLQPGQSLTLPPVDYFPQKTAEMDSLFKVDSATVVSILEKGGVAPVLSPLWVSPASSRVIKLALTTQNKLSYADIKNELAVLDKLQSLILINMQGEMLPEEIYHLTNLIHLNLENGSLSNVSPDLINLKNLSTLSLKNQKISTIPSVLLDTSLQIKFCVLEGNPLLPLEWGIQEKLNEKFDQNKEFAIIPKMSKLVEMDFLIMRDFLNQNGLQDSIMHQYLKINRYGKIGVIRIDDSHIDTLPEILSGLSLHGIIIMKNRLDSLPGFLGDMTTLSGLEFPNGTIKHISSNLQNLIDLNTLDVSNNALTDVPEWMGKLPHLETADFSGNLIQSADSLKSECLPCILDDQRTP